jgi:deoxyribonuclease-1
MTSRFIKTIGLVLIGSCLVLGAARADEGTSDPDFDYLPPDGLFGRMASAVTEFFRGPSHPESYETAKKRLYAHIQDGRTFYCDCTTRLAERTFDKTSCGYVPRNDNERARRIEAEHILPASLIADFKPGSTCWAAQPECGSARECCLKNDAEFKKAHNDLVNLAPAIGELNADRSNLIYDVIDGEPRAYGACDFEVDRGASAAEPKDDKRGDIARVYFYMRDTYGLKYPDDLAERLRSWSEADPVDDAERQRNKRILDSQGTSNPAVGE